MIFYLINENATLQKNNSTLAETCIVCTPSFLLGEVGFEPPTKFSKRGSLAGSQFLEGDCWKGGGDFFQGGGGLQLLNKK